VITFQRWSFEAVVGRAQRTASCYVGLRLPMQRARKSAPCSAKPSKAYSSFSVIKGDKMKSHDAEKLDVEVKLKVEHLTLVA
jgi:hypothetical protein